MHSIVLHLFNKSIIISLHSDYHDPGAVILNDSEGAHVY